MDPVLGDIKSPPWPTHHSYRWHDLGATAHERADKNLILSYIKKCDPTPEIRVRRRANE